jgi:hypothetical protein
MNFIPCGGKGFESKIPAFTYPKRENQIIEV